MSHRKTQATERNVEHEFITMAGHGHGFDRDMDHPKTTWAFDQVLTFLGQHL